MKEAEIIALLRLQRIPYIGDISAKKLLQKFGSAQTIFQLNKKELLEIEGFGKARIKSFFDHKFLTLAEEEYRFIQDNHIAVSYFMEEDYPELLKQCIDGPILLFQKGKINLRQQRTLSIVGTRKATTRGIDFVNNLIKDLSVLNPVIISGFAYGIDIAAHKAAMDNGLQTIGCMAHGLNVIYPKIHVKYKADVENNGGFVTDFWHNSVFDRNNFLKRNRLIAGISEATLVVESAEKGGSLVTADIAGSYDRDVFTIPGRPTDKMSVGCNNLLKAQRAQAITSAADLIYFLNWDLPEKSTPKQPQLFIDLNPEEQQIIDTLRRLGKAELDVLALESKLPGYKVASHLLNLELHHLIRPLPGKQYEAL